MLNGLMLASGHYQGTYYSQADGQSETFSFAIKGGEGQYAVSSFKDDLAIIIRQD